MKKMRQSKRYTVRKNRRPVDNPTRFPWIVFDHLTNTTNWCFETKENAAAAAQRLNGFELANKAMRQMINYRLKYIEEENENGC